MLPGAYTAAAVAGLLASFPPHISLTNKVLPVDDLERKYNTTDLTQLVEARVVAVEAQPGFPIRKRINHSPNKPRPENTHPPPPYHSTFGLRSVRRPLRRSSDNPR